MLVSLPEETPVNELIETRLSFRKDLVGVGARACRRERVLPVLTHLLADPVGCGPRRRTSIHRAREAARLALRQSSGRPAKSSKRSSWRVSAPACRCHSCCSLRVHRRPWPEQLGMLSEALGTAIEALTPGTRRDLVGWVPEVSVRGAVDGTPSDFSALVTGKSVIVCCGSGGQARRPSRLQ